MRIIKFSVEDNKEYCIYCRREIKGIDLKFRAHKECIEEFNRHKFVVFRNQKTLKQDLINCKEISSVYGKLQFYNVFFYDNGSQIDYNILYEVDDDDEFDLFPLTNYFVKIIFDKDSHCIFKIDLSIINVKELRKFNRLYYADESYEIRYIPILSTSIFSFPSLKRLQINQTSLEQIPDLFHKLPDLEEIKLTSDNLQTLPKSFTLLPKLQDLFITLNHITELPEFIGNITSLKYLSLEINNVSALPPTCVNLINITHFCLESQSIIELPQFIFEFHNLECLYLNTKQVKYLPTIQKQLGYIKQISWELQSLKEIPQNLDKLGTLKLFYLYAPNLISLKGIESIHTRNLYFYTDNRFRFWYHSVKYY